MTTKSKEARKEALEKELERIMTRIDKTDIRKIILFGSLATGNIGLTSDIDLVVIKNTKEGFLKRLERMCEEVEPRLALDLLVYTPEEFAEMRKWNSFIRRIEREGRVLYAS
jgi:predicted nucleotidyltransferase